MGSLCRFIFGGAIGGVVNLYAPVAGCAVGNASSTLITEVLEKITGNNSRNTATIITDTLFSGLTGAIFGSIDLNISGITSGRNSMSAVYKSGLTKLSNGTASKMSSKVITKGIISGITKDTYINLINGVIPGAEYWYDGVGSANGGRGSLMCNYLGALYVVDGIYYGRVFE